uniref:Protein kinase domain-containing protein n=1 Tax=Heterorhabditis bacteriophora TaxID=37862 RepID=A0A1I7XHF7_HETBA
MGSGEERSIVRIEYPNRETREAAGTGRDIASPVTLLQSVLERVLAASGAPFRVKEKISGKTFLAQLKPIDDALKRNVDIHNSMDHENIEQFYQVLQDKQLALIVYENFLWNKVNQLTRLVTYNHVN